MNWKKHQKSIPQKGNTGIVCPTTQEAGKEEGKRMRKKEKKKRENAGQAFGRMMKMPLDDFV